jgi:hypothetical protein
VDLCHLTTRIDDCLNPSPSIALPVCPFIICAPTRSPVQRALAAGKSVVHGRNVTSSLSRVPSRFPVYCLPPVQSWKHPLTGAGLDNNNSIGWTSHGAIVHWFAASRLESFMRDIILSELRPHCACAQSTAAIPAPYRLHDGRVCQILSNRQSWAARHHAQLRMSFDDYSLWTGFRGLGNQITAVMTTSMVRKFELMSSCINIV